VKARGQWPQRGAVVLVSVWPDELRCSICQVLRQVMGGKAEGISHGRITAAAGFGSQENDATVWPLRVHPAVIVTVPVNSGHDDGLIACR